MARGRSPLAAKVPAVVNADKAVMAWKAARREHGDDRVSTDLGFVPLDSSIGQQSYSDGKLDASFAQNDLSTQATAEVVNMATVVDAAERGVLIADVSKWGAIAVWLLAWVQSMATLPGTEECVIEDSLRMIYDNIQKKAGEGTRLAIVRSEVDDSRLCREHSTRDDVLLRGECSEPHVDYALVQYAGPADRVDGIIYSSLMEMGRAATNDPWLDPEQAQFVAIRIIASRRWKDAKIRAARDSREESLDVLQTLGTSLMFRFNKDDQAITSASDCEVRNRDGEVVRVIPALTEVTEAPCAPEPLRIGSVEYHESHWKADTRPAEIRALADIHRLELVQMLLDGVRDGIILTDGRTGKPTRDAELVARTACVILFLRSQSSLQAMDHHGWTEGKEKKYRNLMPSEIAEEVRALTGRKVTKYVVAKALGILHLAEDAYYHWMHLDSSGEPARSPSGWIRADAEWLKSCHVCNDEHHEQRDEVRERRRQARELISTWESRVTAS